MSYRALPELLSVFSRTVPRQQREAKEGTKKAKCSALEWLGWARGIEEGVMGKGCLRFFRACGLSFPAD
jgi:hypothetical protein